LIELLDTRQAVDLRLLVNDHWLLVLWFLCRIPPGAADLAIDSTTFVLATWLTATGWLTLALAFTLCAC